MQKILRKRVLRELKENALRYTALGALIIFGMYMIVSMVGASETIMSGVEENGKKNGVEDGQFHVFVPLTEDQENRLEEKGISIEAMFYLDFENKDKSVLRVFGNREKINKVELDEGRMPEGKKEAVVEKRYAEVHNLKPGDTIEIAASTFQVVGTGSVPDYDGVLRKLSDSAVDSQFFGLVFVTDEAYKTLKDLGKSVKAEEYVYAYHLNGKMTDRELKEELRNLDFDADMVDDSYFQEYWEQTGGRKQELEEGVDQLLEGAEELSSSLVQMSSYKEMLTGETGEIFSGYLTETADGAIKLRDGVKELKDETDELMDRYFDMEMSNLTQLVTAEENPRIRASAKDQVINKMAGLIAGIIVMILFTYVISVFVIHGIERESSIIGTFYALGVKKKELLVHYLMLPTCITFLSGIAGTILGFSRWGVNIQMRECYGYFSIPLFDKVYPVYLLIYATIMPPVTAVCVNLVVIYKKLTQPALKLIRNEQKSNKMSNIKLGRMGFIGRFRVRQMLRECRTGFTLVFGMFISLLIMIMGINCYVLCKNIGVESKADTKYEYMYTYKYPEENVPAGGEPCVAYTLKKEIYGYNLDVTLLGISSTNPYFDAEVTKGKNKVVISTAMAQKYGLAVGDKLILADEEEDMNYAFDIQGITQYSTGLYVFMEIESLRELLGVEEDYYNVILSDKPLDIDWERLYGITTRDEIGKSSDVFVQQLKPLIYTLTGVSVAIFCVVMYLMIKIMIDRSAQNIALVKIFGYRTGEIRRLYLNGNFYTVAVGAAVCIPLAKRLMDMVYPMLISNVACGMNLEFSPQLYMGIYGAVIALYLIINQLLVGKVKRMQPAEVLKNRE